MPPWTLYASHRSPFVRKVRMALHEAGLADRVALVPVTTNPMRPAPELAAVTPLGMIPVLVIEAGEAICDSHAILDFLSGLHPALFPAAGPDRRAVLQRHALADGVMDKAVRWLDERFRSPNPDTAAHIAGHAAAIRASLAVWEEAAPGWTRAAPDAGDLAVFCALAYLDFRFPEVTWRRDAPALAAWFAAMDKRASAQATRHP